MDCFIKPRSIKLSQSYVISLLTMRFRFYISIRLLRLHLKTIFHFWQMHCLRLSAHKKISGVEDVCLGAAMNDSDLIPNTGKQIRKPHWRPHKHLLFFPVTLLSLKSPGKMRPTRKMSEHCCWVSPPTPPADGTMPGERWAEWWVLLSPGGRGVGGRKGGLQPRAAFTALKDVWWLSVNSTEFGPHTYVCSGMS